jgi:hypothetical protein
MRGFPKPSSRTANLSQTTALVAHQTGRPAALYSPHPDRQPLTDRSHLGRPSWQMVLLGDTPADGGGWRVDVGKLRQLGAAPDLVAFFETYPEVHLPVAAFRLCHSCHFIVHLDCI